MDRAYNTEILIAGGSFGGVSAALAACKAGRRVIMTEETGWIGGRQRPRESRLTNTRGWNSMDRLPVTGNSGRVSAIITCGIIPSPPMRCGIPI